MLFRHAWAALSLASLFVGITPARADIVTVPIAAATFGNEPTGMSTFTASSGLSSWMRMSGSEAYSLPSPYSQSLTQTSTSLHVEGGLRSLSYDNTSGAVVATEPQVGFGLRAPTVEALGITGGFADIRFDLVKLNPTDPTLVYGTINGQNAQGTTVSFSGWMASVWTGNLTGDTDVYRSNPSHASITLGRLYLTIEAFDLLTTALGLTPDGLGYAAFLKPTNNLGDITLTMGTHIPEPGTWALMGLGLVGVGLAARRRSQQA